MQLKLHGHPQKDFYLSPTEHPILDIQGWFGNPDPLMASHVHIIPQVPLYAELTEQNLAVPFTLKAHMFDGTIGVLSGPQISRVHWDDTNSDTPPVMAGDPNGLKQWTGIAFFDLLLNPVTFPEGLFKFPDHGWGGLRFFTRTALANGDIVDVIATPSVYSMLIPTAPEQPPPQQGNPGVVIRSSVTIWRPNQGAIVGELITEVNDYIPLLPIDKPWTTIAQGYNYTAPPGVPDINRFEQRLDPDLHHGIRGSLIFGKDIGSGQNKSFLGPIVIDPAVMGTGAHKEMVVWTQSLETEAFTSVVVFPTNVGDGVPVPEKVAVPNIVGQTKTQAQASLVAVGLILGSVMEMSDQNIPKDNVISQSPVANTMVTPGSSVSVMVSTGAVMLPTEQWVPAVPTFMQLHINGVPQKRWQICGVDNSQTMDDCVELETKPDDM